MIDLYIYFIMRGKPIKIKMETISGSLGDSRYIFKGKYATIMGRLCSEYSENIGAFNSDERMFFLSHDELCNVENTIAKDYNVEFEIINYD